MFKPDKHVKGEWFRDCPETRAFIHDVLVRTPALEISQPVKVFKPKQPRGPNTGDRSKQRKFFAAIVVFLYPGDKPEAVLAQEADATDRMARYWLDGTSEPSGAAKLFIVAEVVRRLF